MTFSRNLLSLCVLTILSGCGSDGSRSTSTNDSVGPEISTTAIETNRSVYSSTYTVTGSASDTEEVVSLTLKVNNEDTPITFNGADFDASFSLSPGINSYEFLAQDASGNTTSLTQQIYYGKQVSAGGAHSGAIIDGQIWTWGRNNLGQSGLGFTSTLSDESHPTTPQQLAVFDDGERVTFVSLAFNQNASVALDDKGNVWSWGDGDGGQLGLGDSDSVVLDVDYYTPQKISSLQDIIAIARGYDHTVALDVNGNVYTFGENDKGQLGNASNEDSDYPILVTISDIVMIAAGSDSTYAIDVNGILWGWGENNDGQLGQGEADTANHTTPVQIPLAEPVTSVAAGKAHVLALGESGKVYGWGLNASNQVGNTVEDTWADDIYEPTELPWVTTATAIWANGNQSFVEKEDGLIYPWGFNGLGTLGLESDEDPIAPTVAITDLEGILDIGAGALHTISLRNDDVLFSWGWSFEGSLGIADPINFWGYSLPQKIEFNQ
jgi:alpha-tubulin suppressor-like RCC1 family protein